MLSSYISVTVITRYHRCRYYYIYDILISAVAARVARSEDGAPAYASPSVRRRRQSSVFGIRARRKAHARARVPVVVPYIIRTPRLVSVSRRTVSTEQRPSCHGRRWLMQASDHRCCDEQARRGGELRMPAAGPIATQPGSFPARAARSAPHAPRRPAVGSRAAARRARRPRMTRTAGGSRRRSTAREHTPARRRWCSARRCTPPATARARPAACTRPRGTRAVGRRAGRSRRSGTRSRSWRTRRAGLRRRARAAAGPCGACSACPCAGRGAPWPRTALAELPA